MSERLDKQHRYPWPAIETAVRWYQKEGLTYRAVSSKLLNHGMEVSHKTVYEWVQKFGDVVGKKAKKKAGASVWDVEESYVKVNGQWKYMYRAVDGKDNTLDLVFRHKRNLASARSFLKKQLSN